MKKEEKKVIIDELTELLNTHNNIYLADSTGMTAQYAVKLRKLCFERQVRMRVVKKTLLKKAMEKSGKNFDGMYDTLKGATTAILVSETANAPARLIKEFKKVTPHFVLKSAYISESVYLGEHNLDILEKLKSREELIGEVIGLLQSPLRNVLSALQFQGPQKIAALLKSLEEKKS
ncbi:MAG: 50S ribosomal protein L10 [Flavobacteriales bacterium]|nr:50S ribosomal protein L10 [Flavobacteriales bacterium]MCX7768335.1 50S ribosomal protein L10 [Flavobacteriales bacterium]MDW8409105.1 50S ribosomal protein L10 [Flavobacteriales bacterium]